MGKFSRGKLRSLLRGNALDERTSAEGISKLMFDVGRIGRFFCPRGLLASYYSFDGNFTLWSGGRMAVCFLGCGNVDECFCGGIDTLDRGLFVLFALA